MNKSGSRSASTGYSGSIAVIVVLLFSIMALLHLTPDAFLSFLPPPPPSSPPPPLPPPPSVMFSLWDWYCFSGVETAVDPWYGVLRGTCSVSLSSWCVAEVIDFYSRLWQHIDVYTDYCGVFPV